MRTIVDKQENLNKYHNQAHNLKKGQQTQPFSTETRTIGLKSFNDSEQISATDFPTTLSPSEGIKKLAVKASSVTGLSSFNATLPTPAKTIFLQNCKFNKHNHPQDPNFHNKITQITNFTHKNPQDSQKYLNCSPSKPTH